MASAPAPGSALPGLRQELRIERGEPQRTGAPSWTIFDPVGHKFYQIGRVEFLVLSHWAENTLNALKPALAGEGLAPEQADRAFNDVIEFAMRHNLTLHPPGNTVETFMTQRQSMKRSWWRWMVENYLFIRIPLIKPGAFLARTLPRVEFLFSPASAVFFIALALIGLLLVARQWDSFLASFLYFFNPRGFVAYMLGLVCVKVLHELGHAYTATRYGCRVPAMGVAFLVMMPVLYTDTTGAWRIRSRRKRLMVDCAGMMTEMMVASICTIAWVFLPDGPMRSVAFVLATTSWAMSLLVNVNPFMRFDGYYVLSDAANTPNLQPRAFALARWRLREWLFALVDPPPEQLGRGRVAWMVLYAYCTWIYRLILFIGIALLVYHMFFKALGIILFVVEIGVFIARPVYLELKEWYSMRTRIAASSRARLIGYGLLALLILCFLPIDRHVGAPAVLNGRVNQPLVAGDPAIIEQVLVENGQMVAQGAPVMRLRAPNVDQQVAAAQVRLAQVRVQERRATADVEDRANLQVLGRERAAIEAEIAGLEAQRGGLVLRAPVAGRVVDIPRDIRPGTWVSAQSQLARVITPRDYDVQAYIDEADVWRIENGAEARFVPDDAARPSVPLAVSEVSWVASETFDQPILASTQGGPVAVQEDRGQGDDMLRPKSPIYRVALSPRDGAGGITIAQNTTGEVTIDARATSPAMRLFYHIISVARSVL